MKKILIVLIILGSIQNLHSQWILQTSGVATPLKSITFVNSLTGWSVGDNGVIITTTNGGINWTSQVSGTTINLTDIHFFNNLTGIVSGDEKIFKTTNAGINWLVLSDPQYHFGNTEFTDNSTGYSLVGDEEIARTTNGGVNWTSYSTGSGTILLDIEFLDNMTGYISGLDGIVRKTTNGGVNWFSRNVSGASHIASISFLNDNTGWGSGIFGILYKTTNGGLNWTNLSLQSTDYLAGVTFLDNNTGWTYTDNGKVYNSTNGGVNWKQQVTGTTASLKKIFFLNKTTAWMCAEDGSIRSTTTGGYEVGIPDLTSPSNGSTGNSVITALQWSTVANNSGYHLQLSTDSNFVSTIINDSGIASPSYNINSGVLSSNTKYYWRVRARHNSGEGFFSSTWNFTTAIAPTAPILISPANNTIGESQTPLLDWDSTQSISTFRTQVSTDSLFGSTVFDTTQTRSMVTIPAGRLSLGVKYYWRVLSTGTGGNSNWSTVWNFTTMVTEVPELSSEIPTEFKLYNNYPNPFNPATKIRFDIPADAKGITKLTIYDVTGREVKLLVDQQLSPGSYEYLFNASLFSSGIYFYRLQTDAFVETKKMMLLK